MIFRLARLLVTGLLAGLLALVLAGCSRPGEKRCTAVCEHYLALYTADQWDEKLAGAASEEERAQLEQQKAAQYRDMRERDERGFSACVARCDRRSRGPVADCIMEAKTLADAKDCDDDSGCRATGAPSPRPGWLFAILPLCLAAVLRRRARARP